MPLPFGSDGASVMGITVLVAKATLLLMAALGVTALLQRASAGARHLVWVGIVAALLILPAIPEGRIATRSGFLRVRRIVRRGRVLDGRRGGRGLAHLPLDSGDTPAHQGGRRDGAGSRALEDGPRSPSPHNE